MEKLAIYVHWPYCARICPYCDFNVYKRRDDDALLPAILEDLKYWRNLSGRREISSIHFGGGTPSLMTPEQISAVIQQVDHLWGLDEVEIALEANPHEMNEADWRRYRAAGLNRLSLGVQSFDDSALKFLGRDHDGETARTALDLALTIFPSVSADLIFGWAGQTPAALERDLAILLASGVTHISTYQLTIEAGTAFAKAESRGQERAVTADRSADFYEQVRARLLEEGFDHYEVSNFARPNHRSLHNLAYWQGLDYVGVGPGAHGRISNKGKRTATIAHRTPAAYVAATLESATGIYSQEVLSPFDWASEYLIMGLRIEEGISLTRYRELAGQDVNQAELAHILHDGLLTKMDDRIFASFAGRLVLNRISEKLLIG